SSLPTDENCSAGANEDGNCAESMQLPQPAWAPPPGPRPVGALDVGIRYECTDRQVVVRVIRTLDLRPVGAVDLSGRWNSVLVSLALLPARKQRHQTETVKGESPAFGESFVFSLASTRHFTAAFSKPGRRTVSPGRPFPRLRLRAEAPEAADRGVHPGACLPGRLASRRRSPGRSGRTEETLQLPLLPCSGPRSHVGSDTGFSEASSTAGRQLHLCDGLRRAVPRPRLQRQDGPARRRGDEGQRLPVAGQLKKRLREARSHGVHLADPVQVEDVFANATPNPTWKESFMFPINRFQLADVTAVLSIYAKRSMQTARNDRMVCHCRNSSGEEEAAGHWHDMLEARGELVRPLAPGCCTRTRRTRLVTGKSTFGSRAVTSA
uniref:C2 domain-containing protein n=1 Tax=Macrostomum lignano TaxID=282301 RepID=A0A1I8FHF8_9PLAT